MSCWCGCAQESHAKGPRRSRFIYVQHHCGKANRIYALAGKSRGFSRNATSHMQTPQKHPPIFHPYNIVSPGALIIVVYVLSPTTAQRRIEHRSNGADAPEH